MDPHDGEVMETHTADDDDPDSAFTPQPEAGSTWFTAAMLTLKGS